MTTIDVHEPGLLRDLGLGQVGEPQKLAAQGSSGLGI